jgi:hypothetical protein
MKSFFLIKSPLQLLNAIEAKHYFKMDSKDCILIIFGDKKSYPQMLNLVKLHDLWSSVVVVDKLSIFISKKNLRNFNGLDNRELFFSNIQRSSFFAITKLNKLASLYRDANFVFVGDNHNSIMRHFINSVSHKKTVLLDDGVGAMYMASLRKQGEDANPDLKFTKKIKLIAKRLFQGLKDQQSESVIFFSAYNLDLSEKDELIRNNYAFLNKKSKSLEKTDSVYFIGGSLSEGGVVPAINYLKQLKMVRDKYKGQKFVYIAHRRESTEKLNKIQTQLDIEICFFDYPLEYQLAMIGPLPKVLVSFVSSALENLRIIMGDQLKVISYRLIEGTYLHGNRVDSIYSYYAENISDNFSLELLDIDEYNEVDVI